MSHFANGLKQLRTEYGLTQSALAKELNVTQNAIFNWENDRREPNIDMIRKIAEYFNTSLTYLLDGKEEFKAIPKLVDRSTGKPTPIKGPVKFTSPSISRAEAAAQEKVHELFDSIFDDAVGSKREKTAMQVHEMLTSYNQLNDTGKEEARKRVNELTEIPRYTKPSTPLNYVNAAHAIPGASEEDIKHDMDIMNDENF